MAVALQERRIEAIAYAKAAGFPRVAGQVDVLPVLDQAEDLLARLVLDDRVGVKDIEEVRIGLDALWGIYQKLNQGGK